MTRTTQNAERMVEFAYWCIKEGLKPLQAMQICLYATHYCRAESQAISVPGRVAVSQADRAATSLEKIAGQLGYRVEYPGLWPCLVRISDGSQVSIPNID